MYIYIYPYTAPLCSFPGFEPRKIFNVVEFVMHDKNLNGSMDLDEAVELLYARYGRDCVDEHVKVNLGLLFRAVGAVGSSRTLRAGHA